MIPGSLGQSTHPISPASKNGVKIGCVTQCEAVRLEETIAARSWERSFQKEPSLLLDLNEEVMMLYNKGNQRPSETNTPGNRMEKQGHWFISGLLDHTPPET